MEKIQVETKDFEVSLEKVSNLSEEEKNQGMEKFMEKIRKFSKEDERLSNQLEQLADSEKLSDITKFYYHIGTLLELLDKAIDVSLVDYAQMLFDELINIFMQNGLNLEMLINHLEQNGYTIQTVTNKSNSNNGYSKTK